MAVEGRVGCGLTSSKDPAIDLWRRVEGVRWRNVEAGQGTEERKREVQLTLSLVRTKLSTSIERVAPSLGLSSDFFARDMVMAVLRGGLVVEGC
jgi:hypothetical protein